MTREIALLRAINLGAKRKVPMARLREIAADLGCSDVETYVQSGNLAFSCPAGETPAQTATRLEAALEQEFGFAVPVVMRTGDELARILAANPLQDVATEDARYYVLFLADPIDPAQVAAMEPVANGPEAVHVTEREIYVWTPQGAHNARAMEALNNARLGTVVTARNWRTVTRLAAMAAGTAGG